MSRRDHERRNAEDKARSSRRRRDRDAYLDAGTDRWLKEHADAYLSVTDALVAAFDTTTLEEAVDKLRRTLGK